MKISVINEKEPFGLTVSAGTYSPSYETRSGSIVTFSDAWVGSKIYPKASIVPVQSGSGTPSPDNIRPITGYSSVDVSRCGINLFDKSTITENKWFNDNNGTITNATGYNLSDYISVKAGETYYHSGSGSLRGLCFDANKNLLNPGSWNANFTNAETFTVPEGCHYIRFTVTTANIDSMTVNYPSSDTSYHPYNGITKTISLGSTIYGGILNVDSGVLTVTHQLISLNSSAMDNSENYPGWKGAGIKALGYSDGSSIDCLMNVGSRISYNCTGVNDVIYLPTNVYHKTQTEWKALAIDVQMLIPLTTPTTIQLTGEEITALLGENNVWANSGDVEVTYRKGGA